MACCSRFLTKAAVDSLLTSGTSPKPFREPHSLEPGRARAKTLWTCGRSVPDSNRFWPLLHIVNLEIIFLVPSFLVMLFWLAKTPSGVLGLLYSVAWLSSLMTWLFWITSPLLPHGSWKSWNIFRFQKYRCSFTTRTTQTFQQQLQFHSTCWPAPYRTGCKWPQ